MSDPLEFVCDICGHVVPSEHGLKIHKGRNHKGMPPRETAALDDGRPVGPDMLPPLGDDQPPPVEQGFIEQPPTPKGWREKLWGDGQPKGPKAPAERRPRKRRVSTEGVWVTAWTAAGVALVRTGADIPVGNCLQFQAPIVGDILDEAIAGTFLDTLLQPIAGQGKRLKKVSSVLAMPILVGAMERSPAAAPILEPLLRQAIIEHLVAMAPVIKARQKQEADFRKALDELGMDAGDDAIDAVLGAIFPMFGAPETNGVGAHVGAS